MATKKETTSKKPTVKKATTKVAEKMAVVKVAPKPGSLSVPVLSLVGLSTGTLSLPKEIFGEKVNKALLAQAVRVYSTNQKTQPGNTKTRGEVIGSTRKIYRQKGTGNARHGAKKAPIFVGGGITFGPKSRMTILALPKKMRKVALISALSQKMQDGEVVGLDSLEKATGKTKQMFKLANSLWQMAGGKKKKSLLIINDQKLDIAARAVNNIQGISFLTVSQLNAYEVIRHQSLVLTRAAVERLQSGKSVKSAESVVQPVSVPVKKTRKTK